MKCYYLEADIYNGEVAELFCVHPDVFDAPEPFVCPFGEEVDCELNAHLRTIKRSLIEKEE